MNKKFITGALLLAVSVVGCSTFTSCKDTDEDVRSEMTQQYNNLKATLEKLQAQLNQLSDCPEKCQQKIDELKGELATVQAELAKKADQSTVDGIKQDVDANKTEIQNLKNQIQTLISQIEQLELLKAAFEQFKSEVEGNMGNMQGDITGLKGDVNSINTNITNILARLTALENNQGTGTGCSCGLEGISKQDLLDLIALKAQLEGLFGANGVLAGLQGQINNVNTTITGLQSQVSGIEGDVNDMKTTINNLNNAVTNINGDITNIKNSIDGINTTLGGLNTAIAGVIGDVQTITNTITTIQNSITSINTSIGSLQGAITDINGELTGIKGDISGIKDDVSGIQGDISGIQGDVSGIKGDISNINSGLSDLQAWFEGIGITVAEFQDYVKQGLFVKTNHDALEALVKLQNDGTLNEDALKALNNVYQNLEGINTMYETIFGGLEAPEEGWWNYKEVMENIKNNSKEIEALKNDRDVLLARLNDMVTSLILQASTNPLYGSFNTPFGINSMVLMTCYGERTTAVDVFPICGRGAECNNEEYDDIDWSLYTSSKENLGEFIVNVDANNQAKLGSLWFTVNPGTVNTLDLNGFALVNSRDDEPVVALNNITKDDETVLKFGITSRAAGNGNGLYQAQVTCAPEKLDDIKVHIEPGLVNTLKSAVKNHTASDAVSLARAVYNQLQNVCDANALRYSYEAYTTRNEDGSWSKAPQKVYSNYGVAATAFKPLSFATLKGTSIRNLPKISNIEISKDRVNFHLGTFKFDSKNFNLDIQFGQPNITLDGDIIVDVTLKDQFGQDVTGKINITDQAEDIVAAVQKSIENWVYGTDKEPGLSEKAEKAVWYALFNDPNNVNSKYPYDPEMPVGVVVDLINQVNDMTGKIQDKFYNLVDEINKDYLGKVNTLIDKYNTVVDRINNVLNDPNHYLQVTMLYRKAGKLAINGHTPEVELPFALLSTNPNQPTQFRGTGEAISLWATTYNFEVLCPTFRKMVAVTKVTDSKGNLRDDLMKAANETLAVVMPSDRNRVALNVAGAKNGTFTYEIAYQAVDYSGFTSTVKCYVQVVR